MRVNAVNEDKKDKILNIIDNSLEKGANFMTIAMKLRKEGKIEGKVEGKIEGEILKSQNTLIKQMSKKFDLTENEINLIKNCGDINKLDQSLEDILFFDNKNDILRYLE